MAGKAKYYRFCWTLKNWAHFAIEAKVFLPDIIQCYHSTLGQIIENWSLVVYWTVICNCAMIYVCLSFANSKQSLRQVRKFRIVFVLAVRSFVVCLDEAVDVRLHKTKQKYNIPFPTDTEKDELSHNIWNTCKMTTEYKVLKTLSYAPTKKRQKIVIWSNVWGFPGTNYSDDNCHSSTLLTNHETFRLALDNFISEIHIERRMFSMTEFEHYP